MARESRSGELDYAPCATEVATAPDLVLVRDSKNPDGPNLAFGREAWAAFAAKVKQEA